MSYQAFQAPSPESLAKLLPQYDIEFFIAQGGMGAVYKGRQRSLDRDIAIKVLPHEVGASEELRESFISEAKAMARLNHTNLLGVFDYGTVEGMPYIVMEYVSGGSLHQAAYNQAVELIQAAVIVKAICAGLAHAHEHGIVHRDIKPSNILLTQKVEPKVADFGLAHAADWDKPGLMMGTPGYTAPEVFQDPSKAGTLADIYSVGVIFHQLLSGIDPAGSMEPPTHAIGNLRLDAIWRKATNINPALRFPTVDAMAAELDKWISSKQAAEVAPPKPIRLTRPTVQMQHAGGGAGSSKGKLMVVGVIAALAVIAYLMFGDKKQEATEVAVKNGGNESPAAPVPKPVSIPEAAPKIVSLPNRAAPPSYGRDPKPIKSEASDEPEIVVEADDDEESIEDPESPEVLEHGDPDLYERAIGLINDARKTRNQELSDNASALHFTLHALSRSGVSTLVDHLKEEIVDNRIPSIGRKNALPDEIAEAFEDSLAKEELIDGKHKADLTRIRDAYVNRLKNAAAESPDKDLKNRLLAQSAEAEDLKDWIQLLAPESEKVLRHTYGEEEGSFVGKWDVITEGGVERWIGHQDGRVEVVGEKWEVSWVIMDDDTLEVRWDGKKPYKMTQDEEGWSGKTSFGHKVEFKRGDW